MRSIILSLILFLFTGCTITTYHPVDPIVYEPVRVVVYPVPRYRTPIYYNNYYWRAPMKTRTVRKYNGIRVHKKNYWSKTDRHPQPTRKSNTERRHNWRQRKSLKGRNRGDLTMETSDSMCILRFVTKRKNQNLNSGKNGLSQNHLGD